MSTFQTYFQCLMILSDLPIYLVNYFVDIVPNTPMYLWHLFCQADCIAPLPLGGVIFPHNAHPTDCRYCRFPRRSSCNPLADYVHPAELAYRVPLRLTPTLLLAAIFIGCQATMLRDNLLFSYEFLLLLLLLCCHWSQWQPIEPLGEKLWNLAHLFRTAPLAH